MSAQEQLMLSPMTKMMLEQQRRLHVLLALFALALGEGWLADDEDRQARQP
jgi:hypothetical protein